jgi:Tol biopolymer transport system component
MAVDGGEPRKLTDFPMGVGDPVVSPDGRFIAVTSSVYPECGADAECNETIAKDRNDGKLKVHMADTLLYRHWTSWRDGKYSHVLLVDAATGKIVRDMTPGKWDSPTFSLGGSDGYAFSPDGKELVYDLEILEARPATEEERGLLRPCEAGRE